jgi:hypothetical protein|tara:strand:- start:773 stop:1024 length:252 start_codon:yes stop_codon:yes gene_type:complete
MEISLHAFLPPEYVFIAAMEMYGDIEYTIIEFDNSNGEFTFDEAENEVWDSIISPWEIVMRMYTIEDAEEYIAHCMEVDNLKF